MWAQKEREKLRVNETRISLSTEALGWSLENSQKGRATYTQGCWGAVSGETILPCSAKGVLLVLCKWANSSKKCNSKQHWDFSPTARNNTWHLEHCKMLGAREGYWNLKSSQWSACYLQTTLWGEDVPGGRQPHRGHIQSYVPWGALLWEGTQMPLAQGCAVQGSIQSSKALRNSVPISGHLFLSLSEGMDPTL